MQQTVDTEVREIVPTELYEFGYKHDPHMCIVSKELNKEFRATCACGATWTYPKERDLYQMFVIWTFHLKYVNRPKLETL